MSIAEARPLRLALAAAACAALVLSPAPDLLRVPAALVLAVWLPGLSLLAACVPDRGPSVGRHVLAVPLSMACVVLAGLLLDRLGALNRAGWVLALSGLCVLIALGSALSEAGRRTPPAEPRSLRRALWPSPHWPGAVLALAVLLSGGAYLHARQGALAHDEYRYTEFWLAPVGTSPTVGTLGIRNAERVATTYEIEVLDGARTSGRWPSVMLGPGESWTAPLTAARGPHARRVEARLFRDGDRNSVYRQVWMDVPATGSREDRGGRQ